MPLSDQYLRQAALVVKAIPFVSVEDCFALKGGTAINLFIRDLPRLSVDIDLTYLPVTGRRTALREIDAAMRRIAGSLAKGLPGARVDQAKLKGEDCTYKLFVRADGVQTKIEVTPVLRGCVDDPTTRSVSAHVEDQLGFAEIQVLGLSDLYAGKMVAALDRQHPRDLFDVRDLLANEGISDELRQTFIVYLVSHDRPMVEVLAPTRLDIAAEYARGFAGMTETEIPLDDLLQVRENLIADIVGKMPADHKRFLISFKRGNPDWDLLGVPGAEKLPAVRWRLENLAKLDDGKRDALLAGLSDVLAING